MQPSIVTHGRVEACRHVLHYDGLLQFVEKGFCTLDQSGDSSLKGELRRPKAELIRQLMHDEHLDSGKVCLVDFDPDEIASVQEVCQSILVSRGMDSAQMQALLVWAQ